LKLFIPSSLDEASQNITFRCNDDSAYASQHKQHSIYSDDKSDPGRSPKKAKTSHFGGADHFSSHRAFRGSAALDPEEFSPKFRSAHTPSPFSRPQKSASAASTPSFFGRRESARSQERDRFDLETFPSRQSSKFAASSLHEDYGNARTPALRTFDTKARKPVTQPTTMFQRDDSDDGYDDAIAFSKRQRLDDVLPYRDIKRGASSSSSASWQFQPAVTPKSSFSPLYAERQAPTPSRSKTYAQKSFAIKSPAQTSGRFYSKQLNNKSNKNAHRYSCL